MVCFLKKYIDAKYRNSSKPIINLKELYLVSYNFMRKATAIVLFALICSVVATSRDYYDDDRDYGLQISSDARFNKHNSGFNLLGFSCDGGSGDYDFDFDDLPSGWDYSNDGILIPADQQQGRYQLKVIAYDIEYRVSVQRYAVIKLYADGTYEIYIRETYDVYFNAGYTYLYEEDKEYKYPSWKHIEQLIREGDVEQINGIVLKVIDSSNDCDDKSQFLNDLKNRIEKFVRDYQQDIEQANGIISKLEKQLSQLEKNLRQLLKDLKEDSQSKIRRQLKKVENKIDWLEKRIKNNEKKIKQYQSSIKQLKNDIWQIKDKKIPALKKQIAELEKKLKEVEWKIKEGKGDVKWNKKERDQIKKELTKKYNQLKQFQKQIKQLQNKTVWFDKKIKELQKTNNKDKKQLKDFENQRKQLQKELKGALSENEIEKRIHQIRRQISSIKGQINKQKRIIKQVTRSVQILTKNLSFLREKIQESYYQCKDVDFDDFGVRGGSFYGYARRQVFETYVTNNYGRSIRPSGNLKGNEVVQIITVNYVSEEWGRSYGHAFNGRFDYGSNCFFSHSKKSEIGKITRITNNSIYVKEERREVELKIAGCSVVETATGNKLPRVGDNIAYKGNNGSHGGIDVGRAICY